MLDRDLERLKQKEIPRLLEELEKTGEENKEKSVGEYVNIMEQTLHDGVVRTFDDWVGHLTSFHKRFSLPSCQRVGY
ncbi:MAG: hypothetical protein JRH08_10495 [Deltaproteobacteria bacterium]|nr:hypothetical protein [Deltaproteobacteria bacterium]MBW1930496.1 hypothetical protein [Deltaproteobacteria bacterium]MBW2025449.1 hypothetical protein [Deltaproteobacteria bacterium]MBW2126107.1 hypothetical protein [Deltaproteobacteria bacterium]RLB22654.1 MAG: hypothetical protein DRG76_06180 [Deltaproteobacteria bacterium]